MTKILKPFKDATLLIQKEKKCKWQHDHFYNIWFKKNLDAIKCNYSSKFLSVLKSSLKSRLSHFETDDTYQLASMFDPRFKLLWAAHENTEELVSFLQKNASSCDASISEGEDSDTFPPNKKHKSDDFFNFLPKSTPKRKRHQLKAHNLYNVIWKHQPWNFIVLTFFWKTNEHLYPTLAKIAKSTFPSKISLFLSNVYLV